MSETSVATAETAMLPSASVQLPKGRQLVGDRVTYDVNVGLPGELQPQLEAMAIELHELDPGLVLGRKIAVNRTYICYGLKPGAIRVLNINTGRISLLKGHTQSVTDMAFFSEDVHLLASSSIDGRIFVWKINEGPDENDKQLITGKVVVAIHMVGDGESFHPHICWHPITQEILVVTIGNRILKIDITKVGKDEVFTAEKPIKCPVEKLIDGIQLVGKHEGEVTDLSMCHWMITRLVSASTDGMVKIWADEKAVPLVTLRPHNGEPVNSVTFLIAPCHPDHIVLITAGHLNQEVKVWASAGKEGWLLPSDCKSWQCIQTLDLKSSTEPRPEEAFFNHVVVLPDSGLLLHANAKKNAIYAVHVEYGRYPTATRMDYITEFTVTMPILSLTGRSDYSPDGKHVEVYCIQTQAIQQYTLDLSKCLPPPLKNAGIEKVSGSDFAALDPCCGNVPAEMPVGSGSAAAKYPVFSGNLELPIVELATSSFEPKPSAMPPQSLRLSGRLSFRNPSNNFEPGPTLCNRCVDQPVLDYSVDRRVDVGCMKLTDVPSLDDSSVKDGIEVGKNDISMVPNPPITFKVGEIPLKVVSSSESSLVGQGSKVGEEKVQDIAVSNDIKSGEVEVKEVGQQRELDSEREKHILHTGKKEKSFYTQASDLGIEMAKESCSLSTEISGMEETCQVKDVGVAELSDWPSNAGELGIQDLSKDVPNTKSSMATVFSQSPSLAGKVWKKKVNPSQVAGPSSPSISPFKFAESSNEPEETCQVKDVGVAELLDWPSNAGELGIQDLSKDVPNTKSSMATVFSQSPSSAGKMWKRKVNPSQVAGPSSCSTSPFKFAESSNEPEETCQVKDVGVAELLDWPSNAGELGIQDLSKDVPNTKSSMATVFSQSPSSAGKMWKRKVNPSQVAGPSSCSTSPFKFAESSNEPGSSNGSPSMETIFTQILALQESVKELMTIQKEIQKQMTALLAVLVNKEGSRIEAALSESMEKALKSNSDALWECIQEENKKQKLERDRIKQIVSSISGSMNTKWPAMSKKTLKQEIAAIGPAVSRAITPILENTVSSAIADSFQRGVGNKAANQLENSLNSKLEVTVARQIQVQFQTSGKQDFQDALRASLESSVIPAFEQACKAMFEQVDATFQKGMAEHTTAAQQQFESTHSPLAIALRDAMSSASSITQTLSGELANGQRNLLAFMAAGANQKTTNPLATQQNDGPLGVQHDMVEAPLDPKKELERLISEHKYEEAFTSALQRSNITIVSWLCSQVDLQGILAVFPLPLSQGVLLSLLQQLACNIGNETSKKLDWMRDILAAIDPVDPMITVHGRPIFEQVYQILDYQKALPTTTVTETNSIRLLMHVINSVLMNYK
ncbi:enhancer of mRNA-decapping protein 4-like isoform X2 [Magnolia sinica]|uniref:enhancer of mRNA-decapping protein 4-like isoform X2 n=1 Tax=Magnolia sinica TaxID=86752 RepID=UPI002658CB8C|nr:enhancer of mRNA-decapping protein 4-like isoform X2 [Magnolia sinica]